MKKTRIRVFALLLSVCLTMATVVISAAAGSTCYTTAGVANSFAIEVSESTLKTAKSNIDKKTSPFSYYGYISSAYQINIFHFEAPADGYYSFYTTGSMDTKIKVYEEQDFLWWTSSFIDRGANDDGSMADANILNADLILKLDKGEDYYICVRAYSTYTGSYTLHVEPNEDRMLTSTFGYTKWEAVDGAINTVSMCGTTSKQYISKEDAILFYWGLDPATQKTAPVTLSYVYSQYKKDVSQGIEAINLAISFIPGLDYWYSVSATVLGTMIQYAYDSSEVTPSQMMQKLVDLCGVSYDFVHREWVSTAGMRIDQYFCGNSIPMYRYYFYTDNSSVRTGVAYAKGQWVK